jgi:hypothetical protein
MKQRVTSVLEFQELGILLAGPGRHVVRVLGALKVVRPPDLPVAKEDLSLLVDRAPFESYYAEDAPPTPEDELIQPEEPQVPALYVTRTGEVEFLGREVEDVG